MPWSKIVGQKFVLNQEELVISDYKPAHFELNNEPAVEAYSQSQKTKSAFVMSDVVKKISGIEDMEKKVINEVIEQRVLDKISEVQGKAYDQAHQLGYEDGYKAALEERRLEIQKSIQNFDAVITALSNAKDDILKQNEAYIVKLIYHIASRIAEKAIAEDPQSVLPVLQRIIESSQEQENITVMLSKENFNSLSQIQEMTSNQFGFLKKIKLETDENIKSGGCIVETNYGTIDAQVEERVKKMEVELFEALPKIKSVAV